MLLPIINSIADSSFGQELPPQNSFGLLGSQQHSYQFQGNFQQPSPSLVSLETVNSPLYHLQQVTNALPEVTNALPEVTNALPEVTNALPEVTNALPEVTNALPEVTNALPEVTNALPEVPQSFVQGPINTLPEISNVLQEVPQSFVQENINVLQEVPQSFVQENINVLQEVPQSFVQENINTLPEVPQSIVQEPINTSPEIFQPKHTFTPLSAQFINAMMMSSQTLTEDTSLRWLIAADAVAVSIISPWTFESVKKSISISLGEVRQTLPIRVLLKNESQQHIHKLSEEFMVGILSVLHGSQDFSFYLEDTIGKQNINPIPVTIEDVFANYNKEGISRKYNADLIQGSITFDTIDVIHGIITGCQWTKQNPHNFVKNLREGNSLIRF